MALMNCPECEKEISDKAMSCPNCGAPNDKYDDECQTNCNEGLEEANSNKLYCPKCGSNNLTSSNKGFGLGKAAVGGILLGPVGLLAGTIGSSKVKVTCLKCGEVCEAGELIDDPAFCENEIITHNLNGGFNFITGFAFLVVLVVIAAILLFLAYI